MTMTWRRVKRWDMRGRWGRKASCPAARLSTRTLAGRRQFRNRRRGFGRREDHKEWWIVGKQSWPSGRQVKFQEKARPRLERVSSNGEELLTPAGKVSGAWAESKPILKLAPAHLPPTSSCNRSSIKNGISTQLIWCHKQSAWYSHGRGFIFENLSSMVSCKDFDCNATLPQNAELDSWFSRNYVTLSMACQFLPISTLCENVQICFIPHYLWTQTKTRGKLSLPGCAANVIFQNETT